MTTRIIRNSTYGAEIDESTPAMVIDSLLIEADAERQRAERELQNAESFVEVKRAALASAEAVVVRYEKALKALNGIDWEGGSHE